MIAISSVNFSSFHARNCAVAAAAVKSSLSINRKFSTSGKFTFKPCEMTVNWRVYFAAFYYRLWTEAMWNKWKMGARGSFLQGDFMQAIGGSCQWLHDSNNLTNWRTSYFYLWARLQLERRWRYRMFVLWIMVVVASVVHWNRLWATLWYW